MASFSLNQITLFGNINTNKVEVKTYGDNKTMVKFSLVTEIARKVDGEWKNEPQWHNVVVFDASDFVAQKLQNARQVLVIGHIKTEKAGEGGYWVSVIADELVFASDGKKATNSEAVDTELPF